MSTSSGTESGKKDCQLAADELVEIPPLRKKKTIPPPKKIEETETVSSPPGLQKKWYESFKNRFASFSSTPLAVSANARKYLPPSIFVGQSSSSTRTSPGKSKVGTRPSAPLQTSQFAQKQAEKQHGLSTKRTPAAKTGGIQTHAGNIPEKRRKLLDSSAVSLAGDSFESGVDDEERRKKLLEQRRLTLLERQEQLEAELIKIEKEQDELWEDDSSDELRSTTDELGRKPRKKAEIAEEQLRKQLEWKRQRLLERKQRRTRAQPSKGRLSVYQLQKPKLPKIGISEKEKALIISKFLPDSWKYEIQECYDLEEESYKSVYVLIRSNINSKQDVDKWIKDFVRINQCKFILRRKATGDRKTGKMFYTSMQYITEFMCHRNGSRLQATKKEKEAKEKGISREDARTCASFVRLDVLRDTETVLECDSYAQNGMLGRIMMRWDHSHDLESSDVPTEGFINAMDSQKSVSQTPKKQLVEYLPSGKKVVKRYYLDEEGNPKWNKPEEERERESRPTLELTEEMKERILRDFLPEDWTCEITKCWDFSEDLSTCLSFEARSSIEDEEEMNQWVARVMERTGARFFRRSVVRNTVMVDYNAQYACHRSAPRYCTDKIQALKSTNCPTSIRILVKKVTDQVVEKDAFISKGLKALISVYWDHNHDIHDRDLSPELAAAGKNLENTRQPPVSKLVGAATLLDLSTVDKERIIGRFLPEGFLYEVSKCWKFNPELTSFSVEVRVNLETEDGAENWIKEFQAKTGVKIRVRKRVRKAKAESKKMPGMTMKEFFIDLCCHRTAMHKMQKRKPIKRKGYPSKNKNCPMSLSIAIMKDNEKTRRCDPYVVKGLRARIQLFWEHTHDLRDSDLVYRKDLDPLAQKLLNSVNAKSLRLYKKGLKETNECNEERERIVEAAKAGQTHLLKDEILTKKSCGTGTQRRTKSWNTRSKSTPKRKGGTKQDVSMHLSWDANISSYVVNDDGFHVVNEDETEMAVDSVMRGEQDLGARKMEQNPEVEYQLAKNPDIWAGVFGVRNTQDVPKEALGNVCKIVAHSIRTAWTSQELTDVLHQTDIDNDVALLDAALPFIVIQE